MKNSYIVKILLGLLIVLSGLSACKSKGGKNANAEYKAGQQYTCPMHPQIIRDQPGKCPICGMELVLKETNNELILDSSIARLTKPVNARIIASIPAIKPESGTRIYTSEVNGVITYDTRNQTSISSRTAGRIERLWIKYNYQPVRKGQLIMEIYSPDLAAAQRELMYVAKSNPELLAGARQRLSLLGMQTTQIEQIIRTGKILYRVPVYSNSDGYILEQSAVAATTANTPAIIASPAGDGMGMSGSAGAGNVTSSPAAPASSPVLLREGQYVSAGQPLFTIYRANALVAEFAFPSQLAARIKKGQKLLFYPVNADTVMQTGNIGLIEPVFRNGINFTLARVYLEQSNYRVGQLLNASIPVVYSDGWWLPKKAVWRLGNKSVVFRKDGDAYVAIPIQAGVEAQGMVQVITNIGDWEVASNATFLVDSESFIKTENTTQ